MAIYICQAEGPIAFDGVWKVFCCYCSLQRLEGYHIPTDLSIFPIHITLSHNYHDFYHLPLPSSPSLSSTPSLIPDPPSAQHA
jgi:hypothetical protein